MQKHSGPLEKAIEKVLCSSAGSQRNKVHIGTLAALALLLTCISCGSGAPTIPEELLECDCSAEEGDSYPSGPYGVEVGDTVENFTFQGYTNPAEDRTLQAISFSDYYDPTGQRGVKLLLLNTAAAWCQPCQIEHLDLPSRVTAHKAEGLQVVSMLFQDRDGMEPSLDTLDVWVDTFDTNFSMTLDPGFQMGRYGPGDTPPLNLVVDPTDMRILAIFVGNQEGPMWAFIEQTLDEKNQQ